MVEDKLKEITTNLRAFLCCGSDLPENDCVFDEIYAAVEETYNLGKNIDIQINETNELKEWIKYFIEIADVHSIVKAFTDETISNVKEKSIRFINSLPNFDKEVNDLKCELWEEKKKSDEYKSGYDKIIDSRRSVNKLLEELKDKGIIKSWYYNGEYHWEV